MSTRFRQALHDMAVAVVVLLAIGLAVAAAQGAAAAALPIGTTVQWQTPLVCSTVCSVDRKR